MLPMSNAWTDARRKWSFWSRVVQGPDGCWLWTGTTRTNGYGSTALRLSDGRRANSTHRYSYDQLVGSIPDGFEVDHLCGNRACIRPDHLESVTLQENRRRRDTKYAPEVPTGERPIPHYDKPVLQNPRRVWTNGKLRTAPRIKEPVTHCKNGHEYAVVGWVKNGRNRVCAACRADSKQRARAAHPPKQLSHGRETHCPHGHAYSEENTYRRPGGGRECKTCVLIRNRAAYHRNKERRSG